MNIAMIGAGAYGTALGNILTGNGHDVKYYDKTLGNKLNDAVHDANYVILAIPSDVVQSILDKLPKNIPLIIATKGFLSDEIFRKFNDYMVISGPGFADDIKNKKHFTLTITDKRIIDLFKTDYLDFDYTDDILGVLLCGALKNVYAFYAGFQNLGHGSPEWKQYITDVSDEMRAILQTNNASASTVNLACGTRDLELTCDFPSRNYQFGQTLRIDSRRKTNETVEGITTLKRIAKGEIEIPNDCVIIKKIVERFQYA